MRTNRRIAALLILAFLAVLARPACADEKGKAIDLDASYLLQPGDRISIKVYPEDEYIKGGEVEISSEGNITLPLVGKVPVAKKTVAEAEKSIDGILAEDYLVNPQVVIEVLKYQIGSFVILGQVVKPGKYDFPAGELKITLLQAVSLSGGFSDIANIKKIKIMRKSTGEVINVNAEDIIAGKAPDVEVKSEDVIHVSESLF